MAKYKVGDELIIVNDPTEEAEKLKLTDKQWYLAFEDYLNILSCKDHSENNQIEDLNNTLEEFKNGKDE